MAFEGNTSETSSNVYARPITRSCSKEIQQFEELSLFEIVKNIWEQLSKQPKDGVFIREIPYIIDIESLRVVML